jgi:hypothetical protein
MRADAAAFKAGIAHETPRFGKERDESGTQEIRKEGRGVIEALVIFPLS